MIKRFSLRKIFKYTILLLIVFLFYLFPKNEEYTLENKVSANIKLNFHNIFLMDKNNYLAKTKIEVLNNDREKLIDELIEIMTIDGKYQDKIPNGFSSILPVDTKVLNKVINNDILTIDFSKELLETKREMEEVIIEGLIFTLTEVDGINKIVIKVDGNKLIKLPKSGIILDEVLERDFGINKIYNIESLRNITKVIVYYVSKTNNNYLYYIPVTKYINSNNDKIKVIIDELTSKISYESNLMSYLNYNTKLIEYSFNEDILDLNFNEYLFDNIEDKKVLEEVIYSITYSIEDNYSVSKINFFVNNEEIK